MSNPSYGTKVTDSNAPEIQESSGPVASDSLAAESDAFRSGNSTEALGVSGSNSTFANTNTSGATTLPSTSSRPERDDPDQPQYTTQSKAFAVSDTTGSYSTGGSTSNAGTAPTYVNNQYSNRDEMPKGGEEGDFSSGLKNASYNTDIGSRNDPGRVATQKFADDASRDSSGLAGMPRQEGDSGENSYESLERNEDA